MGFNHFTKSLGELTLGSKHNELIKSAPEFWASIASFEELDWFL